MAFRPQVSSGSLVARTGTHERRAEQKGAVLWQDTQGPSQTPTTGKLPALQGTQPGHEGCGDLPVYGLLYLMLGTWWPMASPCCRVCGERPRV